MNNLKKALITGITGQDGAYLTQLLLEKGYEVYGAFRRNSSSNFWRINELGIQNHPLLKLIEFDLTDLSNCIRLISKIKPDEIYNLAAQSYVGVSFDQPITTANITGTGVLHLLEAIRFVNPKIKFYQASSSEMFGKTNEIPQNEDTAFHPKSPYGVSKLFAHWMTVNYKETYNIFAVSGILFNHESPLRGKEFVTRKISDNVAKIKLGLIDKFDLGNLNAKRDWGYAKEYVEAIFLMLQQKEPENYVISTGASETVRKFTEYAFESAGINIAWQGKGNEEKGIDVHTGNIKIEVNPDYFRPNEIDYLLGDSRLAKNKLGWSPRTNLKQLAEMMVEKDLQRNKNGTFC